MSSAPVVASLLCCHDAQLPRRTRLGTSRESAPAPMFHSPASPAFRLPCLPSTRPTPPSTRPTHAQHGLLPGRLLPAVQDMHRLLRLLDGRPVLSLPVLLRMPQGEEGCVSVSRGWRLHASSHQPWPTLTDPWSPACLACCRRLTRPSATAEHTPAWRDALC